MTVGYRIADGTDLDAVFKARTSAAAAATGFRDSSAVDLNSRYEPRGSSTARANTNFRISGGTDLAQVFMDINTVTDPVLITRTMVPGNLGSPSFNITWRNTASGYAAVPGSSMSAAPEWVKGGQTYRLDEINYDQSAGDFTIMRISHATVQPPNNNNVWSFCSLTGVFNNSSGASVKRTVNRATIVTYNDYTSPNGRPGSSWQFGSTPWRLIAGNSYTFEIG